MKRAFVVAATIVLIAVAAIVQLRLPETRSLGNTASGLKPADGYAITPQRAVAIAEPYLETSFDLRSRNLLPKRRNSDKPTTDWSRSGATPISLHVTTTLQSTLTSISRTPLLFTPKLVP